MPSVEDLGGPIVAGSGGAGPRVNGGGPGPGTARFGALCPLLGSALVLAAVAKAYQSLRDPLYLAAASGGRWWGVALVEAEWCLGLWLFTGLHPRATRGVSLAFFAALGCAALQKLLSGEGSCGCLGAVTVRPLYAFAFDVAAVIALLRTGRPGAQGPLGGAGFFKLGLFATAALWIGVPCAALVAKHASDSGLQALRLHEWKGAAPAIGRSRSLLRERN